MNEKTYLDFERPIAELEHKIEEIVAQAEAENLDMSEELTTLREKIQKLEKDIYSNLTRWQKYQLAGHKERPHTLDYIDLILTDFVELHGDRCFKDDSAMVGGFGRLDGQPILVVGQQKGRNTKENLHRNFGMAHPEGYRKALRLMKLAVKFSRPILCLIDTPGAYPGIGAEERGQAQVIAENMFEMSRLNTPILCVVIGEGGSGGALGIGVGDRVAMLEHSYYSVISPEGCAGILWKSREFAERAATALKFTSTDLKRLEIVDDVIQEPLGGAHRDHHQTAQRVKAYLVKSLRELLTLPSDELLQRRYAKFRSMGTFLEGSLEVESATA